MGASLRLVYLGQIPAEMHRDELAIGYNAYSLLRTGKDEFGKAWPLTFRSFNDWKLPGLIYAAIPTIAIFGLSDFAVRSPTAFLAVFLIPLTYLLLQQLFPNRTRSLLGTALVTFSFWHIFLSRTAYEPIAGLTLHIAAIFFLLLARTKPWFFALSALLYAISFTVYNLPLLLAPLTIAITLFIFRDDYKKLGKSGLGLFLGLIGTVVVLGWVLSSMMIAKSDISIIDNQILHSQSQEWSNQLFTQRFPQMLNRLTVGNWGTTLWHASRGYASAFNSEFLFFAGDGNPWHSLGILQLGNENILLVFFLLTSVIVVLRAPNLDRGVRWLLAYLLVAPIPDALTLNAPVTNRLLDFHYALILFASIGLYALIIKAKESLPWKCLLVALLSSYAFFFVQFFVKYYWLHSYNLHQEWHEGFGQVITVAQELAAQVDHMYVDIAGVGKYPDITVPYIYVAYYTAFDPAELQSTRKTTQTDGLWSVNQIGPFEFARLTSAKSMTLGDKRSLLEGEATNSVAIVQRVASESELDPTAVYTQKAKTPDGPIWQIVILNKAEVNGQPVQ